MSNEQDYIKENIVEIRRIVAASALKSGRKPEEIEIIGVTKTIAPYRILKAVAEGILNLGENRVQELCEKYDNINGEIVWHLIGHLQTNKVKYIIEKVGLIHSIDRLELAREINERAARVGKTMDILVQLNVSGEESKFGIPPDEAIDFIKSLSLFKNIKVKGLMTIAPHAENPEDVRCVFRGLRKIFIDTKQENIDNIDMKYLSMGMSNDYKIAIEEGSNMVRIGTAIFGKRNY